MPVQQDILTERWIIILTAVPLFEIMTTSLCYKQELIWHPLSNPNGNTKIPAVFVVVVFFCYQSTTRSIDSRTVSWITVPTPVQWVWHNVIVTGLKCWHTLWHWCYFSASVPIFEEGSKVISHVTNIMDSTAWFYFCSLPSQIRKFDFAEPTYDSKCVNANKGNHNWTWKTQLSEITKPWLN